MGFDGWKINGAEFKWRIDSSASNASPVALEEGCDLGAGLGAWPELGGFDQIKKNET